MPTQYSRPAAQIRQTHEDGRLVAHLFEFDLRKEMDALKAGKPSQLPDFFDTMMGVPGARLDNEYRLSLFPRPQYLQGVGVATSPAPVAQKKQQLQKHNKMPPLFL